MNPFKYYIRWRHFKGYGVHSPYAYRLVTEVIRPGNYGYYAYHDIEPLLEAAQFHDYKLIRRVKFAIRLAVFLKSERIVTSSESSKLGELIATAMQIRHAVIKTPGFRWQPGDLMITDGRSDRPESSLEYISSAISHDIPVFSINSHKEDREILGRPIKKGLLMAGIRNHILIPRREMEYVAYDTILRI